MVVLAVISFGESRTRLCSRGKGKKQGDTAKGKKTPSFFFRLFPNWEPGHRRSFSNAPEVLFSLHILNHF